MEVNKQITLPPEIWDIIIRKCDQKTWNRMRKVCKMFNELVTEKDFKRRKFKAMFYKSKWKNTHSFSKLYKTFLLYEDKEFVYWDEETVVKCNIYLRSPDMKYMAGYVKYFRYFFRGFERMKVTPDTRNNKRYFCAYEYRYRHNIPYFKTVQMIIYAKSMLDNWFDKVIVFNGDMCMLHCRLSDEDCPEFYLLSVVKN